jgi:adenine-specific DNA-methyltransferase
MNDLETKQAIATSLAGFAEKPLAEAALNLFELLGYRSKKRVTLKPNTAETFVTTFVKEIPLNPDYALLADWQTVDFLFQLTEYEVRAAGSGNQQFLFESKGEYSGAIIESYLFFAVTLRKARYTRTQLSTITRAVNRLFPMPAMLLFRHGDALTLSVINRRLHKRDESKDVLEKVTLIKDIRLANPHRAHIEILHDLSLSALWDAHQFKNFKELHDAWQSTLDSSELNKCFYQELANWYFWALNHVRFPDDAPKDRDDRDSLSLIRLITRLVFCWFLREKGLIPDDLFQPARLQRFVDLSDAKKSTYYKTVLQNLFFATLNTEMDVIGEPANRRFSDKGHQAHMVHSLYRYENLVKEPDAFLKLFRNIPFLNGGLFECLDERDESGETRVDGFSDNPKNPVKVPDFLFFGPEQRADLSKAYGELRYSQATVRPLIPLLERYKFTVSENTPIEEEVALDPELLGHVFENLLAAYNPETDTTARKTTGSFYTPRVVVDFMVDESLIAFLESALQSAIQNPKFTFGRRLRQLLSYTDAPPQFSAEEARVLVDAIDQVKVLDPACGSGAYPMGALHKLVFLLGKLDPGNAAWKERQLAKAKELDVARDASEQAIEDAFARDQGDYARKLYLIENCLYGVDIQPIAVQIAKLRCFISLIVEQEPDERLPNRGILPLPNLETKFIAANTLFGLHRIGQMELLMKDIEDKKTELRRVRHEHFLARRYGQKKALRKRDLQLRTELSELLKSGQLFSAKEAEMVANWDPYHADRNADFFDLEWMFGLDPARRRPGGTTLRGQFSLINETRGQTELTPTQTASCGFDILIGNPPYVRQEEIKDLKPKLKDEYFCYTGVADLFVYFYERSFDLLRVGGVLCFISSNKYFRSGYGERLRHFLAGNGQVLVLIDFGDAPVFTAIAYPSILLVRKIRETREKGLLTPVSKEETAKDVGPSNLVRALNWEPGPPIDEFPEILAKNGFDLPQRELKPDGWRLESGCAFALLEKLRRNGKPLSEYVENRFYRGMVTGSNDAFVIDRKTRDDFVRGDPAAGKLLKPYLRGRDVKKWCAANPDLWLCYVGWDVPIKKFPVIYAHLKQFERELKARPEVKAGRVPWFALSRYASDYWQEFEKPKIVYQEIATHQAFAWDQSGSYLNNKVYLIPEAGDFLLAILNSIACWWFLGKIASKMVGGAYAMQTPYVAQIPIPSANDKTRKDLESLVGQILKIKQKDDSAFVGNLEAQIDGIIFHLYGLSEEEIRAMLADLALPDPVRVSSLNAYRETKRTLAK